MKTEVLMKNMMTQIKEAQIKLGYVKETMHLYYPVSSLNAMLEVQAEDGVQMCKLLLSSKEFQHSVLGELNCSSVKDRIEIIIPPAGAAYVHEHMEEPKFLMDVIHLFQENHHCSLSDIQKVFEKHNKNYCFEKMAEGMDFDYVFYFPDGEPDEDYYCVKSEMGHTIYHRFTKADYEQLIKS